MEYVRAGHCTGEVAFAVLKKTKANHYVSAGLGTTLTLSGMFTSDQLEDSNG